MSTTMRLSRTTGARSAVPTLKTKQAIADAEAILCATAKVTRTSRPVIPSPPAPAPVQTRRSRRQISSPLQTTVRPALPAALAEEVDASLLTPGRHPERCFDEDVPVMPELSLDDLVVASEPLPLPLLFAFPPAVPAFAAAAAPASSAAPATAAAPLDDLLAAIDDEAVIMRASRVPLSGSPPPGPDLSCVTSVCDLLPTDALPASLASPLARPPCAHDSDDDMFFNEQRQHSPHHHQQERDSAEERRARAAARRAAAADRAARTKAEAAAADEEYRRQFNQTVRARSVQRLATIRRHLAPSAAPTATAPSTPGTARPAAVPALALPAHRTPSPGRREMTARSMLDSARSTSRGRAAALCAAELKARADFEERAIIDGLDVVERATGASAALSVMSPSVSGQTTGALMSARGRRPLTDHELTSAVERRRLEQETLEMAKLPNGPLIRPTRSESARDLADHYHARVMTAQTIRQSALERGDAAYAHRATLTTATLNRSLACRSPAALPRDPAALAALRAAAAAEEQEKMQRSASWRAQARPGHLGATVTQPFGLSAQAQSRLELAATAGKKMQASMNELTMTKRREQLGIAYTEDQTLPLDSDSDDEALIPLSCVPMPSLRSAASPAMMDAMIRHVDINPEASFVVEASLSRPVSPKLQDSPRSPRAHEYE